MIQREAMRWIPRLQSNRDPDTLAKFKNWYDADPAHGDAFERVGGSYDQSGVVVQSLVYPPLPLEPLAPSTDRHPGFAFALAATIALIAIGWLLVRASPLMRGTDAVMLKTNIGEIRRVALSDGSAVTLDTSTRVEVEIGRSSRSARVKYGRARFEIAPAREPFVVDTGGEVVTAATGTIDVEHQGQESRINVLAGSSQLQINGSKSARRLTLGARDGAVINSAPLVQTYRFGAAPDWTGGMLEFDATPLADVAVLANRYSDQQIILDGNVGQLRVSGAFRAGDTAGLAKSLAASFQLSLRQAQDGKWHLASARQAPSLR